VLSAFAGCTSLGPRGTVPEFTTQSRCERDGNFWHANLGICGVSDFKSAGREYQHPWLRIHRLIRSILEVHPRPETCRAAGRADGSAPTGYRFTVVVISMVVMLGLAATSTGNPLTFEDLDVPNAGTTVANGINDKGQIVGLFRGASGTHGFLLSKGQFATIDVIPGASDTEAYGLNDKGDVVGKFLDSSGEHGFLLAQGTFTSIDIPGASLTDAFGINNRGQIVGHFRDTISNDAFLLSAAGFTRITVPGALLTAAFGINDHGDIVGDDH